MYNFVNSKTFFDRISRYFMTLKDQYFGTTGRPVFLFLLRPNGGLSRCYILTTISHSKLKHTSASVVDCPQISQIVFTHTQTPTLQAIKLRRSEFSKPHHQQMQNSHWQLHMCLADYPVIKRCSQSKSNN